MKNTAEHAPSVPAWLFTQTGTDLDALADALCPFEAVRCGDDYRSPVRSVRAVSTALSRLQQDLCYAADFLAGTVQRRRGGRS